MCWGALGRKKEKTTNKKGDWQQMLPQVPILKKKQRKENLAASSHELVWDVSTYTTVCYESVLVESKVCEGG